MQKSFHDLTCVFEDGTVLYKNLSLTLGLSGANPLTALVGDNGCGKTTLLKQLSQFEDVFYLPQRIDRNETIYSLAGLQRVQTVLERIENGAAEDDDYDYMESYWDLPEKIARFCETYGIDTTETDFFSLERLSPGNRLRAGLIAAEVSGKRTWLFDEPTNHLDRQGRVILSDKIEQVVNERLILIASHDRELLERAGIIYELEKGSLAKYTGNYSHYYEQKRLQRESLERSLSDAVKEKKKSVVKMQRAIGVTVQRRNHAVHNRHNTAQPRALLNFMANRSDKTEAKLTTGHTAKIEKIEKKITGLSEQRAQTAQIRFDISEQKQASKRIVSVAGFSLVRKTNPVSFDLYAGQRLRLTGANGSGKTTLLRMIMNKGSCKLPVPCTGEVHRNTDRFVYLDQELTLFDPAKTLLENAFLYTDANEDYLRIRLGRAGFYSERVILNYGNLSGGEKMRYSLVVITSIEQPDLILLDEPVNNLDLTAIRALEDFVRSVRCAMILVSHDEAFAEAFAPHFEIHLKDT